MLPTRVLDSLKYLLHPAQFVKLDQTLSLALARLAKEEKQPLNEVGQSRQEPENLEIPHPP